MNFINEVEFTLKLYDDVPDDLVLHEMQQSAIRLFTALNDYRIFSNFNGYESKWEGDESYREFNVDLQKSTVTDYPGSRYKFRMFLERSLKRRPRWFETLRANYAENKEHFRELISRASEKIHPSLRRYERIIEPFSSLDRSDEELAQIAVIETALRLAYAKRSTHSKFNQWVGRSYVILLSGSFSQPEYT